MKKRYKNTLIALFTLLALPMLAAPPSQDADAALRKKNGFRELKNPDPTLPNVLLMGDSICNGYNNKVRALLKGKANVYAMGSGMNLTRGNIRQVQRAVLAAADFSVVHFNIGLHGLGNRIKPERYEPLMQQYVKNFKELAPNSYLIWGSITPIWDKETGVLKPDNKLIVTRNAIAERVMKENGILITPLYDLVINKLELGSGIHWSAAGYQIMAEAIAKNIETELAKPRKKSTCKPVAKKITCEQAPDLSRLPATLRPVARESKWWQNRQKSLNARVAKGNVDLIFVGDSITHFWDNKKNKGWDVWQKYYGNCNAVNLGIGGDRTQHVLWRLQNGNLEGISPKVAVVMIGTNNSGSDSSENIAKGVKAIVDEIEQRCPTTRILILGIFPRGHDNADRRRIVNMKANKIIATFADNRTIFYLDIGDKFLDKNGVLSRDIMPDLLHPNTKGYEIWADAIEPQLQILNTL